MDGLYVPSLFSWGLKALAAFYSMLSAYLNAFHCMLVADGIGRCLYLNAEGPRLLMLTFQGPDLKGLSARQMT